MLIDSHCHPNSEQLRGDAEALMDRARDAGVGRLLIVGCDAEDSAEAVNMAHQFAKYGAWAAVGIHPHEASRTPDGIPKRLLNLASDNRVVAVGEIGLDYHYDPSPRDAQRKLFEAQLDWAAKIHKPVVLHIREALRDALDILKNHPNLELLFHCYGGGLEYLDEVLNMGGFCALGGAVTWKNSDELREVARRIPIERLLLETDCPYMTPAPFRGKPNEPSYVRLVYESVARVRDMSMDELAAQVALNADNFFGWGRG
ncbi:MAG: TatD family hydrolase [Synergistaceae bacterium]|nr:TatD family hydrolase [Synergistaceae bacterium]